MADIKYIKLLQQAIRDKHGCESQHKSSIPVCLSFQGQTISNITIEFFSVIGHLNAKECYAWSSSLETAGKKEVFYVVLCVVPISNPMDAVRSVTASKLKEKPILGKIYKAKAFSKDDGKVGMIESDLIFERNGEKAYLVLEWWPNTGSGDMPKTTVEIDPDFLMPMTGGGFFYRGQITIPSQAGN